MRVVGACLCLAALTACWHETLDEQLAGMAWLESADPVKMLQDSMAVGRVPFLEVCGVACFTPELGPLTYEHCYRDAAGVRTIDPTGDYIESGRQEHLKRLAFQFATQYNRLLVEDLDARGERSCSEAEDWDSLWGALNDLAEGLPREPNPSFVGGLPAGRNDFQLHVQKAEYLSRGLYAEMCQAAPVHGIRGQVQIRVTSGNINDDPEDHPGFECLDGAVVQ